MQQAEKTAAETEAERLRDLRLIMQGRVIQAQPRQRLPECLIIAGIGRKQTRENARLDRLKAGQGFGRGPLGRGQRIADRRAVYILDPGHHITDLPGHQFGARGSFWGKDTGLVDRKIPAG